jgi:hypothetical protein
MTCGHAGAVSLPRSAGTAARGAALPEVPA